jgi:hypothetical protein
MKTVHRTYFNNDVVFIHIKVTLLLVSNKDNILV